MTDTTSQLPHDPYITAVTDALTAAGLEPTDVWTSQDETDPYRTDDDAGCATMLSAILIWDGDHQAVNEELPDGITLIWEHPADHWQWGERGPHGVLLNSPEFLPTLGRYSDPAAIVAIVRALLHGNPLPEGHAPYWHPADTVKAAVEAWAADDTAPSGDAQPCGDGTCHCTHVPKHGPCGCDCPQWHDNTDGGQES